MCFENVMLGSGGTFGERRFGRRSLRFRRFRRRGFHVALYCSTNLGSSFLSISSRAAVPREPPRRRRGLVEALPSRPAFRLRGFRGRASAGGVAGFSCGFAAAF